MILNCWQDWPIVVKGVFWVNVVGQILGTNILTQPAVRSQEVKFQFRNHYFLVETFFTSCLLTETSFVSFWIRGDVISRNWNLVLKCSRVKKSFLQLPKSLPWLLSINDWCSFKMGKFKMIDFQPRTDDVINKF